MKPDESAECHRPPPCGWGLGTRLPLSQLQFLIACSIVHLCIQRAIKNAWSWGRPGNEGRLENSEQTYPEEFYSVTMIACYVFW